MPNVATSPSPVNHADPAYRDRSIARRAWRLTRYASRITAAPLVDLAYVALLMTLVAGTALVYVAYWARG